VLIGVSAPNIADVSTIREGCESTERPKSSGWLSRGWLSRSAFVFCCCALLAFVEKTEGKNPDGDIAPINTFVASVTPAETAAERDAGSSRIGSSSEREVAGSGGGEIICAGSGNGEAAGAGVAIGCAASGIGTGVVGAFGKGMGADIGVGKGFGWGNGSGENKPETLEGFGINSDSTGTEISMFPFWKDTGYPLKVRFFSASVTADWTAESIGADPKLCPDTGAANI